jgi:hypothetical protein
MRGNSKVFTFRPRAGETVVQHLKWCRQNLGERGVGWEFHGAFANTQIEIWEPRLITMYVMWQGHKTDELNKNSTNSLA